MKNFFSIALFLLLIGGASAQTQPQPLKEQPPYMDVLEYNKYQSLLATDPIKAEKYRVAQQKTAPWFMTNEQFAYYKDLMARASEKAGKKKGDQLADEANKFYDECEKAGLARTGSTTNTNSNSSSSATTSASAPTTSSAKSSTSANGLPTKFIPTEPIWNSPEWKVLYQQYNADLELMKLQYKRDSLDSKNNERELKKLTDQYAIDAQLLKANLKQAKDKLVAEREFSEAKAQGPDNSNHDGFIGSTEDHYGSRDVLTNDERKAQQVTQMNKREVIVEKSLDFDAKKFDTKMKDEDVTIAAHQTQIVTQEAHQSVQETKKAEETTKQKQETVNQSHLSIEEAMNGKIVEAMASVDGTEVAEARMNVEKVRYKTEARSIRQDNRNDNRQTRKMNRQGIFLIDGVPVASGSQQNVDYGDPSFFDAYAEYAAQGNYLVDPATGYRIGGSQWESAYPQYVNAWYRAFKAHGPDQNNDGYVDGVERQTYDYPIINGNGGPVIMPPARR